MAGTVCAMPQTWQMERHGMGGAEVGSKLRGDEKGVTLAKWVYNQYNCWGYDSYNYPLYISYSWFITNCWGYDSYRASSWDL